MEFKQRYVIQHKVNQMFFADTPERKTKKLFEAKRFYNEEHYTLWLQTSPYAVDPDEYQFKQVEMTIREVNPHVQQE